MVKREKPLMQKLSNLNINSFVIVFIFLNNNWVKREKGIAPDNGSTIITIITEW